MKWMNGHVAVVAAIALLPLAASGQQSQQSPSPQTPSPQTWQHFNGDLKAQKYSPLVQITPENVKNLTVAWKVHTGDKSTGSGLVRVSGSHVGEPSSGPGKTPATVWSATPLFVNDTLYLGTPFYRIFALEPDTGTIKWTMTAKRCSRR